MKVVPYGALVLERLLEAMAPSEVVLSVYGIREGLLYSLMTRHEQAKGSAALLLRRLCAPSARGRWRTRKSCAPGLMGCSMVTAPKRRRKSGGCAMRPACFLDIGWRAHPDYRGEQSLNVIAHSGMSGIDHAGRIFLALAVYHRHVGFGR